MKLFVLFNMCMKTQNFIHLELVNTSIPELKVTFCNSKVNSGPRIIQRPYLPAQSQQYKH